MGIADTLKTELAARLDELIALGEGMPMKQHSRQTSYSILSGESRYRHYDLASWPEYVEWRTSCIAVLEQIVPRESLLHSTVESLPKLGNDPSKVQFLVSFLRSVKIELESGSFESLALKVEAEILADYLDQASMLLSDTPNEPSHIAAAVVAGASLERALRSMCSELVPAEQTTTAKGAPLGLNALIDALKRRGEFNELRAKQLRAWAAIRNSAAHGEFEAFKRHDVESMVSGVKKFLAEHLK